ncbi:hypothetical protein ES703_61920 [subsurface metagenome]
MENYLEQHNKAPCLDYEEEALSKSDILGELDCWLYLDEDRYLGDLTIITEGELIDLFDYIEEEINKINAEKENKI